MIKVKEKPRKTREVNCHEMLLKPISHQPSTIDLIDGFGYYVAAQRRKLFVIPKMIKIMIIKEQQSIAGAVAKKSADPVPWGRRRRRRRRRWFRRRRCYHARRRYIARRRYYCTHYRRIIYRKPRIYRRRG